MLRTVCIIRDMNTSTEPNLVRLPLSVTKTEAEAIDAWRYANRVPNRTEALRRLLRLGLEAEPAKEAAR